MQTKRGFGGVLLLTRDMKRSTTSEEKPTHLVSKFATIQGVSRGSFDPGRAIPVGQHR